MTLKLPTEISRAISVSCVGKYLKMGKKARKSECPQECMLSGMCAYRGLVCSVCALRGCAHKSTMCSVRALRSTCNGYAGYCVRPQGGCSVHWVCPGEHVPTGKRCTVCGPRGLCKQGCMKLRVPSGVVHRAAGYGKGGTAVQGSSSSGEAMRRFPSLEDPPASDVGRNTEFTPHWKFTTKDNLSLLILQWQSAQLKTKVLKTSLFEQKSQEENSSLL